MILIVDDDSVDREHARRCLKPLSDSKVLTASNGKEALEILAREKPDLILSDIRMPVMDGLALVEKVRDEFPLIPIVLMTSKGSEMIAVRALQAGAASYVPKSEIEEILADSVGEVLAVGEARRSRAEMLHYLDSSETRFAFPNDLRLVPGVAAFFQDNMASMGFANDTIRTQVSVAVTEALTNAIIHGNLEVGSELRRTDRPAYDRRIAQRQDEEPYRSRRVHLAAQLSPREVHYVVRDDGNGFDPSALPDPTSSDNISNVAGRGLFLIRTFMDKVEHNEIGNEIALTKSSAAPPSTRGRAESSG